MSKLLFIYERDMPTVSITREIFTHLEHYPDIGSDFICLSDVKSSDIDAHDVIIFMRPNNIYSGIIAREARKAGHPTVTFCDDDLLNLPKTSPTIPWRKRGLLKTLSNSEVIWSSSKYILSKYVGLTAGKRQAIADTIVRPDELEDIIFNSDRPGDTVKIVYAAAPSHAALFEKYISPIVPKLEEEFGDSISFTFVSVHPQLVGVECEYQPGMPLLEYRRYMKEQHFDIGLAPLYNNDFTKCKYFNKFIEYTTQGVVGIYSNVEPYTYVVKNGENGFLADESAESWLNALQIAIKDKQLRKQCVENAKEYLRREHSEQACIERIGEGIPEIFGTDFLYKKCGRFLWSKVQYYASKPFDWLYLAFFYFKTTGIKAVAERVKTHIKESKAYRRTTK